MNTARQRDDRLSPADLLLMALIFALPFMKPPVANEVIFADLLFILLLAAIVVEILAGMRRVRWLGEYWVLIAFVACLAPSLLATSDMRASLFKLATEFYLIGLAGVTACMIDSERKFRLAVMAWLTATALVCLDACLSLAEFASVRGGWLLDYSSNGFGSLPIGNYPRLSLTFFGANMACNYLTVSIALAFVALSLGFIPRWSCWMLLAAIGIAALSTISAGLGGIALLAGAWVWLSCRQNFPKIAAAALVLGTLAALLFLVALAVTPFPHSTAPFVVRLPGGASLYGAGHILTWRAALEQFLRHPVIGIGIGIAPVHVGLEIPAGHEVLTDAHNVFLSIGAQCGVVGLVGLCALIALVVVRTPWYAGLHGKQLPQFLLGAAFLDVLVYQGLGGSFEDTRDIWVLLGLLTAASGINFSRADESNRTADAPLPC
jgi:O-antigen ligase